MMVTNIILLSDLIKIWDQLHVKNTGDIGFADLESAMVDNGIAVLNDIKILEEVR